MGEDTNEKPAEMDPDELPDTVAMQDEFTRDFLQSTEETNEGFYPFLSGTGKFKMDFPVGGKIDDFVYSVKNDSHEEIPVLINDSVGMGMQVVYYSGETKKQLESNLDFFKDRLGYDGEFKSKELKNQVLYYTHFERNGFRTYAGYVLNNQDSGGVEIYYEIDCRDDKEQECIDNKKSIDERAMNLLESIQFLNEDERG